MKKKYGKNYYLLNVTYGAIVGRRAIGFNGQNRQSADRRYCEDNFANEITISIPIK